MNDIMVVLGLLACVTALVPLANRLAVPYPILLVLGGLGLGFVPNNVLPDIVLRPDLVFLLFLPPLLYWAALTMPWREFRAHLRPILLLAVSLVVATMCGVAAIAHAAVPALSWPLAFVAEGAFSPLATGLHFAWEAVGGVGIGLLVGWVVARLRRRMDDPMLESVISLLTPFAAYLPAYLLAASGVLAAVAAGFVVQYYAPLVVGSRSRLQTESLWEVVNFVLNR